MLNQPGLEPLSLFILVLFGLLLAFFLIVWTALGNGGSRRERPARQKQPKQERTPDRPAEPAGQDAVPARAPRQAESTPEAATAQVESRRAADSDSVVSYSVRPRVPDRPPAPAEPRPLPVRETTSAPPATEQEDSRVEQPVRKPAVPGRDGRAVPAPARPAGGDTQTGARGPERPSDAGHGRSSDAFERFLRRSSDDHDDY